MLSRGHAYVCGFNSSARRVLARPWILREAARSLHDACWWKVLVGSIHGSMLIHSSGSGAGDSAKWAYHCIGDCCIRLAADISREVIADHAIMGTSSATTRVVMLARRLPPPPRCWSTAFLIVLAESVRRCDVEYEIQTHVAHP